MRILVTEEQLKEIISENVTEEGLLQTLLGAKNATQIYRRLAMLLIAGAITIPTAFSVVNRLYDQVNEPSAQTVPAAQGAPMTDKQNEKEGIMAKLKELWANLKSKNSKVTDRMIKDANAMNDPNFQEKVKAINEYMAMAAKNQNYDPKAIQVSPEKMIEACNKTGFDLPLLLAQAHLESCFGLTPRARRTNSVFSVGSYDNGHNACVYNTQNDSIEPYISLMQSNYLGSDKTVDDILQPGAFVNTQNNRYASDKSYEKKVSSIRNKIKAKYPVLA